MKLYHFLSEEYGLQAIQKQRIKVSHLDNLNETIFSRMTGSGSCCYAAFETKKLANEAQVNFQSAYPELWTFVGENNTINN